jgi:uncharacterized protein YbjT (DUF2867 family)
MIFGASGMVGEGVLLETLTHTEVEGVLVVGRRTCGATHGKLTEILHRDLFNLSALEPRLKGYDACFFCLGISSVGMNEEEYRRTTYDLTMHVATTLSRLNPQMTFCYVSGQGTDSTEQGKLMWARVKGKTENDLTRLPFKAVFLFRPGLMKPVAGQKNIKPLFKIAGLLYAIVKTISPRSACTLEEVGRAMLRVSTEGYPKKILDVPDILDRGRGGSR